MKKKLIAGNWKMNGNLSANVSLLQAVLDGSQGMNCQAAVCVPAAYLAQVQSMLSGQSLIALGSQDVSAQKVGAYTGEISAGMLKDFAVRYVIVGHSERRQHHAESNATVADKAQRALSAGITPIVCVGETLADREAGLTEEVVKRQLAAVIQVNGHCISEIVVAMSPCGPLAQVAQLLQNKRKKCTPCCVRNLKRQHRTQTVFLFCMVAV